MVERRDDMEHIDDDEPSEAFRWTFRQGEAPVMEMATTGATAQVAQADEAEEADGEKDEAEAAEADPAADGEGAVEDETYAPIALDEDTIQIRVSNDGSIEVEMEETQVSVEPDRSFRQVFADGTVLRAGPDPTFHADMSGDIEVDLDAEGKLGVDYPDGPAWELAEGGFDATFPDETLLSYHPDRGFSQRGPDGTRVDVDEDRNLVWRHDGSHVTVRSDGTLEGTRADGSVVSIGSDDAFVLRRGDRQVTVAPDGTFQQRLPNGTQLLVDEAMDLVWTLEDAEVTVDADGDLRERLDDGTELLCRTDGTLVRKAPDGAEVRFQPDASISRVLPDGTEIVETDDHAIRKTLQDGTVVEVRPDGQMRKQHPDGTTVTDRADGVLEKELPDGTVIVIDAGKTTVRRKGRSGGGSAGGSAGAGEAGKADEDTGAAEAPRQAPADEAGGSTGGVSKPRSGPSRKEGDFVRTRPGYIKPRSDEADDE